MIRRDYFIRLIEALGQEMRRVEALKEEKRWDEAGNVVDEQIKRMTGRDAATILKLSETELFAVLIESGASQEVREKAWALTMLLKQAGDLEAAQDHDTEADTYYYKALHLLLKVLHGEDAHEFPEFVPQVEALVEAIDQPVLPVETEALLMEHYETTGQFDRAEKALQAILKAEPGNAEVRDFGIEFYERLQGLGDERLVAGNLPRADVEAGLAKLKAS